MTAAILAAPAALVAAAEQFAQGFNGGEGTFANGRALTTNGTDKTLSIDYRASCGSQPMQTSELEPGDMVAAFVADARFAGQDCLLLNPTLQAMPQFQAWMDGHIPRLYFYTGPMPE